ncbi:hypothetical protein YASMINEVIRUS_1047 [Yasminevirus sp. GU-2018]|uniref:Uncharacterized protein n=1 Tax=Yasminevirus sp. GU-2018 TaxID=2420051 RepID=A0A5K0UAS6_9VIRU|nr:hypothetical protein YASMINEVIRUS_1047 [Yasminevirus sp. GU-2018]
MIRTLRDISDYDVTCTHGASDKSKKNVMKDATDFNRIAINKMNRSKILPVLLTCTRPECSNYCKELSKAMMRRGVFFIEKTVDCQDEKTVKASFTELCTGVYRFVKKVFITSDIAIIDKMMRVVVTECVSSKIFNQLDFLQRFGTLMFHIDETGYDVYRYVNELKLLVDPYNVTSYLRPNVDELIESLDNIEDKTLWSSIVLDRFFIEQLISLEQLDIFSTVVSNIFSSSNVSDFCSDVQLLGYDFHSHREMMYLVRNTFPKINIRVVINVASNLSTLSSDEKQERDVLTSRLLRSVCRTISNINPIDNNFSVRELTFDVLYREESDIKNLRSLCLQTDTYDRKFAGKVNINYHDLIDDEDDLEIERFTSYINDINPDLPKGVSSLSTRSIVWWYMLYKYQNRVNFNAFNSDILILLNADQVHHLITDNKITDGVDESDVQAQNDLTIDVINSIDCAVKDQHADRESISILDDAVAIGTKRVMLYYMLLYSYIGAYKPWLNVRRFTTNGVCNSDEYYKTPKHFYTDPLVQMTEHILHFSDVVTTNIRCVDRVSKNSLSNNQQKTKTNGVVYLIKYESTIVNEQFCRHLLSMNTYDLLTIDYTDSPKNNRTHSNDNTNSTNSTDNEPNEIILEHHDGFDQNKEDDTRIKEIVKSLTNISENDILLFWFLSCDDVKQIVKKINRSMDDSHDLKKGFKTVSIVDRQSFDSTIDYFNEDTERIDSMYVVNSGLKRYVPITQPTVAELHGLSSETNYRLCDNHFRPECSNMNSVDVLIVLSIASINATSFTEFRKLYDSIKGAGLTTFLICVDDRLDSFDTVHNVDDPSTEKNSVFRYIQQMFGDSMYVVDKSELDSNDQYERVLDFVNKCRILCTDLQNILIYGAGQQKLLVSVNGVNVVNSYDNTDETNKSVDTAYVLELTTQKDSMNSDKKLRLFCEDVKKGRHLVKYRHIIANAKKIHKKYTWGGLVNMIVDSY